MKDEKNKSNKNYNNNDNNNNNSKSIIPSNPKNYIPFEELSKFPENEKILRD